ncbi:MAG: DUF4388 domain-containing protein, partial [Chloroflexi bacterium]|nr:DUF4388 domain-containing protein [Chloroflexota bacterium]
MELSGSLSGLGVRGLLQILERSRQTGRVCLRQGRWSGEIDVVDGKPVGAAVGHDVGAEALVVMARAFSSATFAFEARPARADATTAVPLQVDEASLDQPAGSTPLLERVPRLSAPRPEAAMVKVDRRVVGLLREVDGRRTVDGIAAWAGLGPTLRGLDALSELGLIELAPTASRPALARPPAAPPSGPRPPAERRSTVPTGPGRSPAARRLPPPPLATRPVRPRPAGWARVRPPVPAGGKEAPLPGARGHARALEAAPAPARPRPGAYPPAPTQAELPPGSRATTPAPRRPLVATGPSSPPPDAIGRARRASAPMSSRIVAGLAALGLAGLAVAAGVSLVARPDSSAPSAAPIVEATTVRVDDAAPPAPEATPASLATVGRAAAAAGAESAAAVEPTAVPPSPTAAPPPATPTADAAWATLLTSLDATWNSDWPTVIDRLTAFRRAYPDFTPAQDKLYVALLASGRARIATGDWDGGRQQLEQAQALLPARPEAPAALGAVAATTPAASDPTAPAGDSGTSGSVEASGPAPSSDGETPAADAALDTAQPAVDDTAVGGSDSSAPADASEAAAAQP